MKAPDLPTTINVVEPGGSVATSPVIQPPGFEPTEGPPGFEPLHAPEFSLDADERLGALFEVAKTKPADRHAIVLDLVRKTKVPAEVLQQRLPEFQQAAIDAEFDPAKFRRTQPELAQMLLERPEMAPVAMRDERINAVTQAMRGDSSVKAAEGLAFEGDAMLSVFGLDRGTEAPKNETKTPRQVPTVESPLAKESGLSWMWGVAKDVYGRGRRQSDLNAQYSKLLAYRMAGLGTEETELRIAEMEREIEGPQVSYGEGAVGTLLIDSVEAFSSQVDSLKGGGVGAAVAGGATLAVTRSPAAARKAAGLGFKVGGFAASDIQETGSAYKEFLSLTLADGSTLDPQVAAGAALLYGQAAAGLEVWALGAQADSLMGRFLASGNKEALAKLVANKSVADAFKNAATAYGKTVLSEGGEEAAQEALNIAIGVAAKVVDAPEGQGKSEIDSIDVNDTFARLTLAAGKGAVGGAGMATPFTPVTLAGEVRAIQKEQAEGERQGAIIAGLTQLANDSLTSKASPEFVAELVKRETRATGSPVTSMFIDTEAFTTLFQSQGIDPNEGATALMGEDGPKRLQEAIATGGRLEVPVAEYLEKWGGKDIAKQLQLDIALRPGGMTERERQASLPTIEEQAKKLVDQAAKDGQGAEETERDLMLGTLHKQLVDKGYSSKDAAAMIAPWRRAIEVQAEDAGVDPDDLTFQYLPHLDEMARRQPPAPKKTEEGKAESTPAAEATEDDSSFDPSTFGDEEAARPDEEVDESPLRPDEVDDLAVSGMAGSAEDFDFGENRFPYMYRLSADEEAKAKAFIWKMRPKNRTLALEFLEYSQGRREKGPKLPRAMELNLAQRFGIVDPVHGFTTDRTLQSAPKKRKGGGAEPGELKRARLSRQLGAVGMSSLSYDDIYRQAAFHGSPHMFEKFSLNAIGTGEGAQVYGWGLYFAQNRRVAENYRQALVGGGRVLLDGRDWLDKPAENEADRAFELVHNRLSNAMGPSKAPAAVRDALEFVRMNIGLDLRRQQAALSSAEQFGDTEEIEDVRVRLAELEQMKAVADGLDEKRITFRTGQLYQVDVPEDSELLDYEAPLEQQPQSVIEKLNTQVPGLSRLVEVRREIDAIAAKPSSEHSDADRQKQDALRAELKILEEHVHAPNGERLRTNYRFGETIYRQLSEALGGERQASEMLLYMGIPGLRYLDQGSRASGEGTHNFVIWDDSRVKVEKTFYQGEDGAVPRGFVQMMRRGMQRIFKVVLTDKADKSTFLHESAHVFLEMMRDLSKLDTANERLKGNYEAALKWLGSKDGEITEEMHEKWARGFEAYLREGKAPSAELEGAFERFKEWLVEIYRTIASLNVEIDDEIRGVFDRLLATDEEIQRAHRRSGAAKTNADMFAEEVGMTPEQAEVYRREKEDAAAKAKKALERKMLKDALRRADKEWKAEEKLLRKEAAAEYDRLPAVQARVYLSAGDLRLDKAAVEAAVGEVKTRLWKVAAIGEDPNIIAGLHGFETGRQMLEAVLSMPSKDEWSKQTSAVRMEERHPSLLADRARLRDEADKAAHAEPAVRPLFREWAALRAFLGKTDDPPLESIEWAARLLASRAIVSKLGPGRALQAERFAAERAFKALRSGDHAAAYVHKQQQILNFFLFRELSAAVEQRERFRALIEDLASKSRRQKLGLAGRQFLDVSDQVLEALGVKPPLEDEDRVTIDQLVASMGAEGLGPAFDVAQLRRLLNHPRVWGELQVEEMRNTDRALRQLKKLASDAGKVRFGDERLLASTIADRIAAEAAKKLKDRGVEDEKGSGWLTEADAMLHRPELILERLGATAHKFFFRGYLEGRKRHAALAKKTLAFFDKVWGNLPKEMQRQRFDPVEVPELVHPSDVDVSITRDRQWLWMVALNMGNDSNRERLLGGYRWDEKTVLEVLDKHLSKEEWDFIQGVWDLLDQELYPEMARVFEAVNGLPPDKILPRAIKTRHGEMRGGYFPAKYNAVASRSRVGAKQDAAPIAQLFGDPSARASVLKGFTKERAKTFSDVIDLQWSVVPNHVAGVIQYVAFDEYVRGAARVLLHPSTRHAVTRGLGSTFQDQLEDWLKHVANSNTDAVPKVIAAAMKGIGMLRARTVMSSIGFSMSVALGDLSNPFMAWAAGEVGGVHLTRAYLGTLRRLAVAPFKMAARGKAGAAVFSEAAGRSEELAHRQEALMQRLRMELGEVGQKRTKLDAVRESAWFFMEQTDRLTSGIIWEAVYSEQRSKKAPEADASRAADDAVRRMMPASSRAEQPSLLRDRRSFMSLVVFHGYFNTLYNVERRLFANLSLPEAAGRTLAVLFVSSAVGELLSGRGPDEDEEWVEWMGRKMLVSPLLLVPFGGDLASALEAKLGGRRMSERAAPASSAIARFVKNLDKVYEKEGEDAVWAAVEAALVAANLPASQPLRTLKYLEDVLTGDTQPAGPADFASGLIYGEREGQPTNLLEEVSEVVEQ